MTRNRVLVLDGPGTGIANGNCAGGADLKALRDRMLSRVQGLPLELEFFQSDYEEVLTQRLGMMSSECLGVIFNAGALGRHSTGIRDSVRSASVPLVEVRCRQNAASDGVMAALEDAPAMGGVVAGSGIEGYLLALEWFVSFQAELEGGSGNAKG